MSITLIALIGILIGFLCLVIGFFMDDASDHRAVRVIRERRARPLKKKVVVPRRKAA